MVLLYAPSHRQDSTYHSLCYTSRGALAGTRNSYIKKAIINKSICSGGVIKFCFTHGSRCHYTKSNPIDDHSNISSKTLQKQNFKPLGHYTYMQCATSHLQTVQEKILSRIILVTYRKFTVATVRSTQNVSCNILTHPIYQQVANVTV